MYTYVEWVGVDVWYIGENKTVHSFVSAQMTMYQQSYVCMYITLFEISK